MENRIVVKVQFGFNLGDPYVGVVKYVETHFAHHKDNFENHLYDIRHTVATP